MESQGKGQNIEIQATEIEVYGTADVETYPLQKKGHTMEFLRSIAHLRPRTNYFWRLRFGIGKPSDVDIADYVLSNFSKDDAILMDIVFEKAGFLLAKVLLSSDPNRLLSEWGKVNVN